MAFYKDEFIGCRTGDVKTYAQMKEEAEQMIGKFGAIFTGKHDKELLFMQNIESKFLAPEMKNNENNAHLINVLKSLNDVDLGKYGVSDETKVGTHFVNLFMIRLFFIFLKIKFIQGLRCYGFSSPSRYAEI